MKPRSQKEVEASLPLIICASKRDSNQPRQLPTWCGKTSPCSKRTRTRPWWSGQRGSDTSAVQAPHKPPKAVSGSAGTERFLFSFDRSTCFDGNRQQLSIRTSADPALRSIGGFSSSSLSVWGQPAVRLTCSHIPSVIYQNSCDG